MINKFTLTACFGLFLKDAFTNAVSLPALTGSYGVGILDLQLDDYSRSNGPFGPGIRSFMISVYYPSNNADKYPLSPYVPQVVASYLEQAYQVPNGTLSLIQPSSHIGASIIPCDETQAIIFSPGFGVSRYVYSTLAEDLASHGYLVVTIDHPYNAAIVQFSDGSVVTVDPNVNLADPATLAQFLELGVGDTKFTLDLLYKNITKSIPGVRRRLKIKGTGMFGHSFGGATTAEVMLEDDRVDGGIDLDGAIQGNVLDEGLDRPFILMGTPEHNLTSLSTDPSWDTFWGNVQGWKRALVLEDSRHLTYSDFPAIIELLDGRSLFPEGYADSLLGTINGLRATVILRVYIRSFFDFVLRGGEESLFDGPNSQYPEVLFQD